MTRSLAITIAALVVAGVGLWLWGTSDVPRRAQPAEPSAPEELAPLAPPPAEPLPSEPNAQALPAVPSEPSEPAAPQAPALAPAPAPAEPAPDQPAPDPAGYGPPSEPIGPLAKLKGAYDSDPVDPQAREAEHEIRAQFGQQETPIEVLQDVRCRKRACKVELRWLPDKPHAYMGTGMMIAMKVNPEIAIEPIGKPDKTQVVRYNLYVARDGFENEALRQQPSAQ